MSKKLLRYNTFLLESSGDENLEDYIISFCRFLGRYSRVFYFTNDLSMAFGDEDECYLEIMNCLINIFGREALSSEHSDKFDELVDNIVTSYKDFCSASIEVDDIEFLFSDEEGSYDKYDLCLNNYLYMNNVIKCCEFIYNKHPELYNRKAVGLTQAEKDLALLYEETKMDIKDWSIPLKSFATDYSTKESSRIKSVRRDFDNICWRLTEDIISLYEWGLETYFPNQDSSVYNKGFYIKENSAEVFKPKTIVDFYIDSFNNAKEKNSNSSRKTLLELITHVVNDCWSSDFSEDDINDYLGCPVFGLQNTSEILTRMFKESFNIEFEGDDINKLQSFIDDYKSYIDEIENIDVSYMELINNTNDFALKSGYSECLDRCIDHIKDTNILDFTQKSHELTCKIFDQDRYDSTLSAISYKNNGVWQNITIDLTMLSKFSKELVQKNISC